MREATEQWSQTGRPARVFAEFSYKTRTRKEGGWDRERRVVAKAEHIDGKDNPRFVVLRHIKLKCVCCGTNLLYGFLEA